MVVRESRQILKVTKSTAGDKKISQGIPNKMINGIFSLAKSSCSTDESTDGRYQMKSIRK